MTVSASAMGASVCHVSMRRSGVDSGGIAEGSAPIVGTLAMPSSDKARANSAPSTMPVSMYGTRGSQRLPAIAASSVNTPTASTAGFVSSTCVTKSRSPAMKLGSCGTAMPKKLRS